MLIPDNREFSAVPMADPTDITIGGLLRFLTDHKEARLVFVHDGRARTRFASSRNSMTRISCSRARRKPSSCSKAQ